MKRSDMIELMASTFKGAINLGSEKDIFGYVLTRMEEAGMYPPYGGSDPWGYERCKAYELIWESEDEVRRTGGSEDEG